MAQNIELNSNIDYSKLLEILIESDNKTLARSMLTELKDRGHDVSQLESVLEDTSQRE